MAKSTVIMAAALVPHEDHRTTACKSLQDVQPDTQDIHTIEVEDILTIARSKARLCTILMALYLVMFIGALDQTVVA